MNKQQFIEKKLKEIRAIIVKHKLLTRGVFSFEWDDIEPILQSALSECWDMAEGQRIKPLEPGTEKYFNGWSKLGEISDSLTSQKEGKENLISLKDMIDKKECENCGTYTEQHTCVDCEQDIPSYICEKYKGMCPHCSWLIGK